MTDLPSDVVERVARAIARELYVDTEYLSPDKETGTEWIMARAALVSSRYMEMREALEKIAANDRPGWGVCDCPACEAIRLARAALSPNKDDTK